MKYFDDAKTTNANKMARILLIVILCIGAITPCLEFIRTTRNEIKVIKGEDEARTHNLPSVFIKEKNNCYDNFIANTDTIFYKYLSK